MKNPAVIGAIIVALITGALGPMGVAWVQGQQAEAKVVAWLWNVAALKENFIHAEKEDGFDIHRGNAARIFQVDYLEFQQMTGTRTICPRKGT